MSKPGDSGRYHISSASIENQRALKRRLPNNPFVQSFSKNTDKLLSGVGKLLKAYEKGSSKALIFPGCKISIFGAKYYWTGKDFIVL